MTTEDPKGAPDERSQPDDEAGLPAPAAEIWFRRDDADDPYAEVLGSRPGDEPGELEVEVDAPDLDDPATAAMVYEMRLRVTDRLLGVIDDEVWDRALDQVLDEYWPDGRAGSGGSPDHLAGDDLGPEA